MTHRVRSWFTPRTSILPLYGAVVTYRANIRGYLLEEALAWLLRNTGYQVFDSPGDDPEALDMDRGSLVVKGRGADHQVDVLGEFSLTPAFSLPIRMFLEAKFHHETCDLDLVRKAHGIIFDVNENFLRQPGSRPRRRFQYVYSLFSTSGFTEPAQKYALAHQISLIDLSGESFAWLRSTISETAAALYTLRSSRSIQRFPVNGLRRAVRTLLNPTLDGQEPINLTRNAPLFNAAATDQLQAFASGMRGREEAELLLGFPAAPFVLVFASDSPGQFVKYADNCPSHTVRLQPPRIKGTNEWALTPWDDPDAYRLGFTLPDQIADWINEKAEFRRKRIGRTKDDLLSVITIYRQQSDGGTRVYQLRYEPSALHRSSSE
jgi:hypothetical protein